MKWFALLTLLALFVSCSRPSDLAGDYSASHNGLSGKVDIRMRLTEDGSGKWEVAGEELAFTWSEQSGLLIIRTRDGGVVEVRVEGATLKVDVPGVGTVPFVRFK